MKRTLLLSPMIWRVVVGLLLLLGLPERAEAQLAQPNSLLLGGGVARLFQVQEVDPVLPVGARMLSTSRPRAGTRYCSLRYPVCVHTSTDMAVEDALAALEQAYERVVLVLGAPPPLPDGLLGGGPELDVYFTASPRSVALPHRTALPHSAASPPSQPQRNPGFVRSLHVYADAPQLVEDVSSAFCVIEDRQLSVFQASRCLGQALSFGLDAAESPSARVGFSEYATWIAFGADNLSLQVVDDSQANPQITALSREQYELSEAGAVWWSFLESRYGAGHPLELPLAVFQLSLRPSDAERRRHPRWLNEPDILDVLRAVFENDRKMEALYVADFATARLFTGARADRAHGPGLLWLGALGKPRVDWVVPYSSLPRNVVTARALEPYGMTYLWLDMDKVPAAARLGIRVNWEGPVRFYWRAIGLDSRGREVSRWDFPYLETKTEIEKTLINLDGVSAIVLIGTNLGGVDLSVPFDPDFEPWEPHRATIYLAHMD